MSISDPAPREDSFEYWLASEFAGRGPFTALVVLLDIEGVSVTPLCSTYFSVIGVETDWGEITLLFAGSGVDWDGACFFPVAAASGGPLDNPTARLKLREIESRIDEDRLALNDGHFFDKHGRRMMIEEVSLQ